MRTLLGTLAIVTAIGGCSDNGNDIGTEREHGAATGGSESSVGGSGAAGDGQEPAGGPEAGGSDVGDPGPGGSAGGPSVPLSGGEGGAGSGAPCEDQGQIYQHGETWRCECNTCHCEDGQISSTLMECDEGSGGLVGTGGSDAGGSSGSGSGGAEQGGAGGISTGGVQSGGQSTGGAATGGASTGGAAGEGSCASNAGCAEHEYCYLEPGLCSGTGVCEPLAEGCIALFDPVCGCDGVTYGNGCEAAQQGANVRFFGACEDAGQACGGRLGDTCTENEYCDYQAGQSCGAADETAVCRERPTACDGDYSPVCGCDGRTHSNACVANSEGTGILHTGEC